MQKQTVRETPSQILKEETITGERVILRPVTFADTERILRWRNDPAVRDRFVYREELTKTAHETWLLERVEAGYAFQWIICEKQEADAQEHPVGSVYLRDIDKEEQTAEYGIFIGEEEAKGKGYGKETARLILQHAFSALHFKSVGLRVYRDNEQARKGYLAAGFRDVRILPAVQSTDGTCADMIWMEAKPQV